MTSMIKLISMKILFYRYVGIIFFLVGAVFGDTKKLVLVIILSVCSIVAFPAFSFADIVLGVSAGFVATAPTADPGGSNNTVDFQSTAVQHDAPSTSTVTEIGWYCDNASQAANYEVGIYDDDAGKPNNLLGSSTVNAKGTDAGWKVATGLNISITSGVTYHIVFQLDNTSSVTSGNVKSFLGDGWDVSTTNKNTLADPWGTSTNSDSDGLYAVYALYGEEAAEAPTGRRKQIIIINN